jgi:hypothetical protein
MSIARLIFIVPQAHFDLSSSFSNLYAAAAGIYIYIC